MPEISQLIKQAVPEIYKEGKGKGKAFLFDLNLSIKPVKKFFVYKCKLSLSHELLYSVDLFKNKLKTKFNNLFYRMILNTKRQISPQELNKYLKKFYLSARKSDDRGRSVLARQNYNRWQR